MEYLPVIGKSQVRVGGPWEYMPVEKTDVELTEHRVSGEQDVQSEGRQQEQIRRREPTGALRPARAPRRSAQRTYSWALLECRSCAQSALAINVS